MAGTIIADKWQNGDGTENFKCKAWVNFNGTVPAASMIRASGNVNSITDNGTGDYTINFTTAMPNANYSFIGIASYVYDNWYPTHVIAYQSNRTTTSQRISCYAKAGLFDVDSISIQVFG
jgi:hypothetical protein